MAKKLTAVEEAIEASFARAARSKVFAQSFPTLLTEGLSNFDSAFITARLPLMLDFLYSITTRATLNALSLAALSDSPRLKDILEFQMSFYTHREKYSLSSVSNLIDPDGSASARHERSDELKDEIRSLYAQKIGPVAKTTEIFPYRRDKNATSPGLYASNMVSALAGLRLSSAALDVYEADLRTKEALDYNQIPESRKALLDAVVSARASLLKLELTHTSNLLQSGFLRSDTLDDVRDMSIELFDKALPLPAEKIYHGGYKQLREDVIDKIKRR